MAAPPPLTPADGWRSIAHAGTGRFADIFGTIDVRAEGDGRARCRLTPLDAHANIAGEVHGGLLMAFVDQALFVGPRAIGRLSGGAVTIEASVRMIAPGAIGIAVDAVVEIVGETGRMLFLRGLIEQDGRTIASFEGTLRKLAQRRIAG